MDGNLSYTIKWLLISYCWGTILTRIIFSLFLHGGRMWKTLTGVSFIHSTRSSLYFSGFKFSNIYYSNIFDFLAHGQVDKTKKCFFLLQYGIPPHNWTELEFWQMRTSTWLYTNPNNVLDFLTPVEGELETLISVSFVRFSVLADSIYMQLRNFISCNM